MQNRRARLDDRPTDRPDDAVSHQAKKNIIYQIENYNNRGRRKI
jgi:hypothetical protein